MSGGPEEARQRARDHYPPAFEAFWRAYPFVRGNAKDKAADVFQRLRGALPEIDVLLACVRGYGAMIDAENARRPASDPYRVMFAASWLRAYRWKDFERAAQDSMAREAAAAEARAAAIPAGVWDGIAARFGAAHGWAVWDAIMLGARLGDGDPPSIEFPSERHRRFTEDQGWLSKLQLAAGGGLLVQVRVRAAS